ncbi:MAG: PilZ domain-containing protein [Nitrospira sp.]|nr:PilZ domain-containing protein [Nitrospira sp.]
MVVPSLVELSMLSTFSRRIYLRYQVRYPVIYGLPSWVGEGEVINLSLRGCLIRCGLPIPVGEPVRMGVLLPNSLPALTVERGIVRWANAECFGVEFLDLSVAVQQRLNCELRGALMKRLGRLLTQPSLTNEKS